MPYDLSSENEAAEKLRPLRAGLPAWTYSSAELLELEYHRLILASWQLACHISDVPDPGCFFTFDLMRDSILIIRDEEGELRAFQNVCRHRASRLLDGTGQCRKRIVCPYHGWNYRLDGRLAAVPSEHTFPGLEKSKHGLIEVELEIFHGFVFVRVDCKEKAPSVAEIWGDIGRMLSDYDIPSMVRLETGVEAVWDVNWKVAIDNNLENYHIPIGHPGYQRMLENDLSGFSNAYGVAGSVSHTRDRFSSNWSERHYQTLAKNALTGLSDERAKRWIFFSMPPNLGVDIYPDCMDFFQILPLGPKRSLVRAVVFGHKDERREMRLLRYLNGRINAQVGREDFELCQRVQAGLASHGYELGPLSDYEGSVRHFHDLVRRAIPAAGLAKAPRAGTLAQIDRDMHEASRR